MQKIVTPKGETLVLLPLEEYERLVDASDIAEADRVRANIAAGRDEIIPAKIVNRILAGENPVRVWRQHRGLSARDVAEEAGLSAAYISEIETGKKDGSGSAVKRIAEVLGVEIDDLVMTGSGGPLPPFPPTRIRDQVNLCLPFALAVYPP